jgi:hypothetical protein
MAQNKIRRIVRRDFSDDGQPAMTRIARFRPDKMDDKMFCVAARDA